MSSQISQPQISLSFKPLDAKHLAIDVYGKGLPDHFTGLAFDLFLDGPEWTLQEGQFGSIITKPDDFLHLEVQKLHRVSPELHKIVFGLTVKQGTNVSQLVDGHLFRFILETQAEKPFKAYFRQGVLSVFDGTRQNIPAFWQNQTFGQISQQISQTENVQKTAQKNSSSAEEEAQAQDEDFSEENTQETTQEAYPEITADVLGPSHMQSSDQLFGLYMSLGFGFLLLMGFWIWYYLKSQRQKRQKNGFWLR